MIHSEELETEISAGSAPGMRYVKGSQAEEWETVKVAVWKQMQVLEATGSVFLKCVSRKVEHK